MKTFQKMKQEFCTRLFSAPLAVVAMAVLWTAVAPLVAEGCLQCKHKSIRKRNDKFPNDREAVKETMSNFDRVLQMIDEVTNSNFCENHEKYRSLPLEMPTNLFDIVRQKVDLVARVLEGYFPHKNEGVLKTFVKEIFRSGDVIFTTRIAWTGNGTIWQPVYYIQMRRTSSSSEFNSKLEERHNYSLNENRPWLDYISAFFRGGSKTENKSPRKNNFELGRWTKPYYTCDERKWLLSYTTLLYAKLKGVRANKDNERYVFGNLL
ncbi:probable G-protein coupled receptor CG31760 [Limulus polyphemus]|uniref:Probable G-protein coupled receptor CG31760 n=1 Tax=Limulus polyphemus TaxID=6850 RepID=A0ABM1S793_LIMPO|nr:probable G-protein coupled receptor CG31760 [Limulus polyphemus]